MQKAKKTPQELYQLLQDVTKHIIAWAKPGMKMSELDREARRMLGEYSAYFTHSLGH
jgi:Xaa-Pro aminopeptidase